MKFWDIIFSAIKLFRTPKLLVIIVIIVAGNVYAQESPRTRGKGTKNPLQRYDITFQCQPVASERVYPLFVYLAQSEKAKLNDRDFIKKICTVLVAQIPYVQSVYEFFPVQKKIQLAAMHSNAVFNAGSEPGGELMFVFHVDKAPSPRLMSHFMAHEYGHLVLMDIMPVTQPIKEWSNALVAMHELFADAFVALFESDQNVLPQALSDMGFQRHITQRYFDREIEKLDYDPLLAFPHAATQPARIYLNQSGFFLLRTKMEAIARLYELRDCISKTHQEIKEQNVEITHLNLNEQFIQLCVF